MKENWTDVHIFNYMEEPNQLGIDEIDFGISIQWNIMQR